MRAVTDQDFASSSGVRSWAILPWAPRRRMWGIVDER
jgi:hypothetical protein